MKQVASTKKIYLIRHGETDYNRRGVVQGSGIDADLNDLGRAQAAAFFEAYHGIPFDKIYTSSLRRTIQSVNQFIDIGLPYESHSGLNEISWGIREGKVPNYADDEYYLDLIQGWRAGDVTKPTEGGESPTDVKQRQVPVLDLILSRPEEKTILVAMHGRAMRILLTMLLDQPLSAMDQYEHRNLCLYLLQYHYGNKRFTLELANDTHHLLPLAAV
ncbi:MAG: histidine phosphatase family protein [Cytophagaceae bacterium]|nr:histidine phosphatase family protein [Cytophagaceae bacterium]